MQATVLRYLCASGCELASNKNFLRACEQKKILASLRAKKIREWDTTLKRRSVVQIPRASNWKACTQEVQASSTRDVVTRRPKTRNKRAITLIKFAKKTQKKISSRRMTESEQECRKVNSSHTHPPNLHPPNNLNITIINQRCQRGFGSHLSITRGRRRRS